LEINKRHVFVWLCHLFVLHITSCFYKLLYGIFGIESIVIIPNSPEKSIEAGCNLYWRSKLI
jgi:hypothetical protein